MFCLLFLKKILSYVVYYRRGYLSKINIKLKKHCFWYNKMALYDNKYWLLSHINNSFISTDDTGMCELVMLGENKEFKNKVLSKDPYPDPEDSEDLDDDDDIGSYDIEMDMEYIRRERSNTAARLERLDYAKKKASKMKHIKWETNQNTESQQNSSLFIKKEVENKTDAHRSGLTELLEKCTNLPLNPYMEFAKFDGCGQVNIPTRRYRIYLTMLPEEQRNYPLEVCCVATARVQDLIGLTLLKFSTNHGDFPTKPATNYGLYITEEDGEVDRDFPCLDPKESVAKFGFNCLGLVEHKEKSVTFEQAESLHSSEEGSKKRTTSASKADENKQIRNDLLLMDVHNRAMEAPLYQSYKVFMVNKVRQRTEINLGITFDKFEIDPVQHKSSKFSLARIKPVSYHIDTIARCEITDVKPSRTTLRVIYNPGFNNDESFSGTSSNFGSPTLKHSTSFKNYEFETDHSTAEEIEQKINLILEMRPSSATRKEYLASMEKKQLSKRKSFSLTKSLM